MADLIENTEKIFAKNLDVFIIMMVVFLIIYYLFSLIAAAFTSGFLVFVSGIIAGIFTGFALGWYVATLYDCVYVINAGRKVDYGKSLMNGLNTFTGRKETLVSIIGLYVIGGVLAAGTGFTILGSLLSGLFIAAATAVALVSLGFNSKQFDFMILREVHEETPNAGFFIYITVFIAVVQISIISLLQVVMLPFAVIMIGSSQAAQTKPQPKQPPLQPTPAPVQAASAVQT